MADIALLTTGAAEPGPSILYCWAVRQHRPVGLPYSSQNLLPPPSDEEDGSCQRARKQRLPSAPLLILLMKLLGQVTLAQHHLKKFREAH